MQPYFFPYLGYWRLLKKVDLYIVYDDVNYIKGGWINRNKIIVNGQEKIITLPLCKASPNKKINEINILRDEKKIKKLLQTIKESYKNAPYFKEVYNLIEEIFSVESPNLSDFLFVSIKKICEYLNIQTKILKSSELEKDNILNGQEKIINICSLVSATTYINAIGGQELYSKDEFNRNGIELKFLKSNNPEYQHFDQKYYSSLSIIDVMMFNDIETIHHMLEDYEVI